MKKKLFNAIRKIFKIEKKNYLEFDHKTYANEQYIPTYDNWKISAVSINPVEDTLRIFSENGNWLMYQDVNIQDFDTDELYDLYDEMFDYFLGEDEWGTSQDFLENFVLY
jgi:hypothetical protein